jgi:hypothetical protein
VYVNDAECCAQEHELDPQKHPKDQMDYSLKLALNKVSCSNAANVSILIDYLYGGSFRKQKQDKEPSDGKVSQECIWCLIAFSYFLIWQMTMEIEIEVKVEVAAKPVEMAVDSPVPHEVIDEIWCFPLSCASI